MPTLKNRQRVGLGDFSGVRRQQPMRQNGCSLTRLFLAGILSQLYALYADISSRVMGVIGRYAPQQHEYSIDESILYFRNIQKVIPDLTAHAAKIRKDVYRLCKIPVCVGGGSSITLSKIANRVAKKERSLDGVLVIESEDVRLRALKSTPLTDVWGVGRRLAPKLNLMGIKTAYDLSQMNLSVARNQFSVNLERTVRELNGQVCFHWDDIEPDQRQIFSTRSLGTKLYDLELILQALSKHAGVAATKARKKNLKAKAVVCFISTSAFQDEPVYLKGVHEFEYATNDTIAITRAVNHVGKKLFREGVAFSKVGVGLLDLTNAKNSQMDMFNPEPDNPKLMQAMDVINSRYGRDTLFVGAQGCEQKWDMRREFLSKEYTTNWNDIPVVNSGIKAM
ncbi:DUF4113 domain-containing protein [Vibrio gangliei]|uniref:DUF4113 domain-containing protein n=1 Tax=Vibrio gangliei TaxID=2077090 RepID=UPI000D01EED9|nr:DUF4113 domain-containing protein [Vibrio gangliei]